MSNILTITLNPAIDKTTTVDKLIPEKKLYCSQPTFEPGGGGVNVARAIKKLGGEATALYLAGGYSGKFFTDLLVNENLSVHPIEIAGNTRENLIVYNSSTGLQYRFGMPGPLILESEWKNCLDEIERSDAQWIIASGSMPTGVPEDFFGRIALIAKKKNAKLIVDTSGSALLHAADKGVFMLKPNLSELSSLVGKEEIQIDMVDDVAREIIGKGQCEVVVVSLGPAGAMLVTKDMAVQITPPAIKPKSTVGAGDSMVGGIIFSLQQGKSLLESIQYGVATGTAATMNSGTELCKKEDADRLFEVIRKQKYVLYS